MKPHPLLLGLALAFLALFVTLPKSSAASVSDVEEAAADYLFAPMPPAPTALPCSHILTPDDEKPTGVVYSDGYEVSFVWRSPPGFMYCGGGAAGAWIDDVWYPSWLTSPTAGVYKYSIQNPVSGLSHGTHTVKFRWEPHWHSWTFTQVRCGTSQLADGAKTNTPSLVEVTFTGGSADCNALSWGMRVDGAPVAATLTKTGTTYKLSYAPTPKLGGGTHRVEAWVEESCCRPDGTVNKDTAAWTFTIPDCGRNALQLVEWGPTNGPDARFSVYARFRDVDTACDLVQSYLRIDGADTGARAVRDGNDWVFNYFPPSDFLLLVPHTAEVYVKEACCNNLGESNEGHHSWTFTAGFFGEDYDDHLPGFYGTQGTPALLGLPATRTTVYLAPIHYAWEWWGVESFHLDATLTVRFEIDGNAWVDETFPLMV